MAGEPQVTIIGNLTADPELRTTNSGQTVVNFTVAQTLRVKDGDNWKDGETIFWRCSAWRDHAENIAATLTKGQNVIVYGRLSQRSYETNEGQKRMDMQVAIDDIGVVIRRTKPNTQRAGGQYQDNPQQREVGRVVPTQPDTWDAETPF